MPFEWCSERKGAQRKVGLVGRNLPAAFALDLDKRLPGPGRHDVKLVPQLEGGARAVKSRPEIGGGGRGADREARSAEQSCQRATSARIESTVGSTSAGTAVNFSTAAVSLSPWP